MKILGGSSQGRCIMILAIIALFYVAYKGYCKYTNRGKNSIDDEEESNKKEAPILTKTKESSPPTVDGDKINRTVDNIMRKQI